MSNVIEVNVADNLFNELKSNAATFHVLNNKENPSVGDFILFKEVSNGNPTHQTLLRCISYTSSYLQAPGSIIVSLQEVPSSYVEYLKFTKKESAVFRHIISNLYLHSSRDRHTTNVIWDIIHDLLGHQELSEEDIAWYMKLWREEE